MNFTVKNKRTQSSFSLNEHQYVLTAAIEAGLSLPHSCRAGNCGSCKAYLINGDISVDDFDPIALSDTEQTNGQILLCRTKAKSDLEIDIEEFTSELSPTRFWPSRVKQLKFLNEDVVQLLLDLPPGKKINYLPGQYIDFVLSDNRRRSFSIANAVNQEHLEFHIRKVGGGEFTTDVFENFKVGKILRFYGPLGTFFLRENSTKPIILLAGGTGFAPIKALLEQHSQLENHRAVKLFWGVRDVNDAYMKFWLERFDQLNDWFDYTVVLSVADNTYSGPKGFVHQFAADEIQKFNDFDVYASGPPKMISAAQKRFFSLGLAKGCFYFDSFDYSVDTLAKINLQQ